MSDYIFLIRVFLLWPTGRQVIARRMVCGVIMTGHILTKILSVYDVGRPLLFVILLLSSMSFTTTTITTTAAATAYKHFMST